MRLVAFYWVAAALYLYFGYLFATRGEIGIPVVDVAMAALCVLFARDAWRRKQGPTE